MSRGRPRHATLGLLIVLAAAAGGAVRAAEPPSIATGPHPLKTSCVDCHGQLDGALLDPVTHAKDDIHFQKGLSCHDCHGGNPTAGFDGDMDAAHDRNKGWTGKPSRAVIPKFCARCHSNADYMKRFNPLARVDQYNEYLTSEHGKRHIAGDMKTAICIDCHGVHGIRAVSDPRSSVYPTHVADTCAHCHADTTLMASYGLQTSQFADYKTSVHAQALYDGGDLSAPTCNDCHGSHGAVPPGVENVAAVCGSCHSREATLFRETEAKKQIDLSPCIQCMVCHGNHAVAKPTDDMLGVGPRSTCTGCHAEGTPQYAAARTMSEALTKLTGHMDDAKALLDQAEQAGVEVGPDRFKLKGAQDQLVEARVLVHSFDLERFMKAASDGIAVADDGVQAGHRAEAELRFRRVGLGLSLIVIIAVIVALSLKVREIERRTQV